MQFWFGAVVALVAVGIIVLLLWLMNHPTMGGN